MPVPNTADIGAAAMGPADACPDTLTCVANVVTPLADVLAFESTCDCRSGPRLPMPLVRQ